MIPPASTEPMHCDHECVCNKYIDYTNTGATAGRACNGETWCFKPCPHDTRSRGPVAQQAPAPSPCFDCIDRICPMRDGISRENSLTCPGRLRLPVSFDEMQTRDAATAAQAREDMLKNVCICNFDILHLGINEGTIEHVCERTSCIHVNEPWVLCKVVGRPTSMRSEVGK